MRPKYRRPSGSGHTIMSAKHGDRRYNPAQKTSEAHEIRRLKTSLLMIPTKNGCITDVFSVLDILSVFKGYFDTTQLCI